CYHVPDQTFELAADRRGDGHHLRQARCNYSTNASCRLDCACRTPFVCRHPNWQLDRLAEATVWRCHRIKREDRVPGLDAEAIHPGVAASDFHAWRALGFLVGFDGAFLAR